MPEGDTIYRAAHTLRAALAGKEITDIATTVPQIMQLGPARVIGQRVAAVEPRGKHLLMWFQPSDLALHSHMRMSGSWHTYRPGQPWRKARRLARIVLTVHDVVAVCFSAPVIALLTRSQVERHPALLALGTDALADEPDLAQARRRLDDRPDWPVGEALLDQRVLAGVGNVYKSEVCFLHGVNPWTPVGDVPGEVRDALLTTAVELLRRNATGISPARVTTTPPMGQIHAGGPRLHVYGRTGRPCPRCATPIRVARQGQHARVTYWCPRCQGAGSPQAGG